MAVTNVLPSYTFGGNEAYDAVPAVVAPYGRKVCIIGGKTALEKAMPVLEPVLAASDLEVTGVIVYGTECSFEKGKELAAREDVQAADVLFAVGGGKAIDTVKVVSSYQDGKRFFTFPTIAATCAATSKVAAVYKETHEFDSAYYPPAPAVHCFINSDILVAAPEKYIWAGMGDTIAKQYETSFSARNADAPYETEMGVAIAKMCADPIFRSGVTAMESAKAHERTEAFDRMVLAVVLSTGLASNFLEEDYNSNAAHAMCYGFTTSHKVEQNHLHGEIVSYGVLVLLTLDKQTELRDKWIEIYRQVGWPTKLAHLDITREEMDPVFDKAMVVRDMKVSPYVITREMLVAAVEELEAL